MATGPEHYRIAENSLPLIHQESDGVWAIVRAVESLTHATLALAAATGTFGETDVTRTPADVRAWENVAGEWTEGRRRGAQHEGQPDHDFLGEYMAEVGSDDEREGAEIDEAVESTGHVPGWADNEFVTAESASVEHAAEQPHGGVL